MVQGLDRLEEREFSSSTLVDAWTQRIKTVARAASALRAEMLSQAALTEDEAARVWITREIPACSTPAVNRFMNSPAPSRAPSIAPAVEGRISAVLFTPRTMPDGMNVITRQDIKLAKGRQGQRRARKTARAVVKLLMATNARAHTVLSPVPVDPRCAALIH